MEFKPCLVVLHVATLAMVASAEATKNHNAARGIRDNNITNVGDVIREDNDMSMVSEAGRRQLVEGRRYISYESKNNVPCGLRGHSYYNCRTGKQANPYTRGCSYLTQSAHRTADIYKKGLNKK